ncbi:MAG: hypothetical protein HDT28_09630 [Clostridiales bacterium]|nr:hypothetical protein [Clostridiales bacterium]
MSSAEVQTTRETAYSKPEELTNFITYAVAAALSFVGLVFLLIKADGAMQAFSSCVFGLMPLIAFTVGALGHIANPDKQAVRVMRRFERCIIALLMLGVMAPILLIGLPSGGEIDAAWGYVLFSIIAAAVAAATVLNAVNIKEYRLISLILYVLVAVACAAGVPRILSICGWELFSFAISGCAVYLIGTIVCAIRTLPARHVIWHLFVICGAVLHFVGVYIYLF